ncbi:VWA domain-containing protein [Streptomyces sp. NPDC086838]|uniref:VWA domain-containing protein n=1 Tax=Streptomyces sp. NPDC086838 TaxID=3365762 RepID=UPI0038232614
MVRLRPPSPGGSSEPTKDAAVCDHVATTTGPTGRNGEARDDPTPRPPDHSETISKAEVRSLLKNTASLGVFWFFVGFGRGKLAFNKNLNASASATFHNVAFYDASKNPGSVPGDRFYDGLVNAFSTWMKR